MADTPDGKQIALVAAQTMDTIGSAEANLFIDFNGGPRQFAFMLLSMANLAKFRKTKIARVISMNYDNKINGMIPIQDMDNVFTSHDLVSGMDEFINFGRSSSLKKYFRNTGNPAIHSVLNAMEQFSDDLLLCRVEPLLDDIDRLKEKLNDYTCSDSARTSDDDYDVLFMYVTEDILRSFQPLFDKQLPEMIQWCVENDFIMQALTFVTELSPHYFAQTAFQPTKEEWDDFLHALKHKNVQKTSLRDSAKPSASDDKKDYDWFNSWTNSRESDKIKRSLNGLVLSPDSVFPEIRNWEAARLEKTILRQWPEAKDDKLFACCKKALEKRAILESTERVLAAASERTPADFERAVCLYNILKEQRHLTNHASTTGSNVWSLDTVKKYLRIYVDLLRKLR